MGYAYVTQEPDCCNIRAWARAYPRQGFEFDCWKSDGVIVSTEEILGIDVVEDLHLVAYFKVYDGIEEDCSSAVVAYPNPGGSTLNIRTALQNARVKVYDTNGRLIHSQALKENVTAIDAVDWAAGVYVWKVYANNKEAENGKWIKGNSTFLRMGG